MDISLLFQGKIPDDKKLFDYGFTKKDDYFIFEKKIDDNNFSLVLKIFEDGKITSELIDVDTDEEYTLHFAECAKGAFIQKVKDEYNDVIKDFTSKCFEFDNCVFKENVSKKLIKYIKTKYGDELEFLWPKYSKNAVVRRKDSLKWYAVFMTISKNKLGFASDKEVEIIDLHTKSENVENFIMKKGYFPVYHMNKKHWITIILDGSVDYLEICNLIDESYALALK